MDNRLRYLLDRYCEGSVTESELAEFYNILVQRGDHQELKDLLDENFDQQSISSIPLDRKEFIRGLIVNSGKPKARRLVFNHFFRYAAAVLILASAIGTYYWQREAMEIEVVPSTVSRFSNKTLNLPDGTVVILKKDATLQLGSTFGTTDRAVFLRGEAYFSVAKDSVHSFVVNTPHGIAARVLGTKFNVRADSDKQVEVTVSEGRVQVESGKRVLKVLGADQQLVYSTQDHRFAEKKVDASKIVSWQTKDLYFNDLTLNQVAKILEEKYQIAIHIKDAKLGAERVSATFLEDESLEDVLHVLCSFLNASYKKGIHNEIIITK
ncbi:FecR family protein [Sphingobacterium bambusae]|uniref:FecR family protein n=1 Tax=Sphingobacterium bambusae TaxID=662858 RepID=A0ABW6BHI7_9SPHI|nr:FecR domain-containing protein [Sphingobacterium bambusae]WPL49464.1 FecR domain-containing protein [Sphingobacterium bambusae]